MSFAQIAIYWGQKEKFYSSTPFLPGFTENFPYSPQELLNYVHSLHSQCGNEITFYWSYPFWVLANHLFQKDVVIAGLSDFEAVKRTPDLILLVDLPRSKSGLEALNSRYPNCPIWLLTAETPLERQAQHHLSNLSSFRQVFTYSRNLLHVDQHSPFVLCNLPFRFPRSHAVEKLRSNPPSSRQYKCAYVGNAHSSGWRRNYQYDLGFRGWPLIWQYMQGWSLPLSAALQDEKFGAYGIRMSVVLAASEVFLDRFFLSGQGWSAGGSGWLARWFPDRRLRLPTCDLGLSLGSKLEALCDCTFTLACENYVGNPGYVSEKLFDAMAAGSIPIYIGAPDSLPVDLKDVVIDLSGLPRRVLRNIPKLQAILTEIAGMPYDEMFERHQACLNFMDQRYEQLCGLQPFLKAFDRALDALGPCASS